MRRWVMILALLLCTISAEAEAAPVRSYAVVIGNNAPHNASASPLRYADDDALAMYELFSALPGRAILVADPDPETRKEWNAPVARAVSVDAVKGAVAELSREIVAARRAGWRTAFYLFFSGHGDREARSYLYLDRPFDSAELYALVDSVPADVSHVILDACHAVELIASRGEDERAALRAQAEAAAQGFLDKASLQRHPRVGVIVATTPHNETLEWTQLRHGVFTYVVRSALLGGADSDGDGRVSYEELQVHGAHAFANLRRAEYKLALFAEPPQAQPQEPVIDLRRISADRLSLAPRLYGRFELQRDQRPYATLNPGPDLGVEVVLLGAGEYRVRQRDAAGCLSYRETLPTPVASGPRRLVVREAPTEPSDCSRGLSALFSTPVSAVTAEVVRARLPEPVPRPTTPKRASTLDPGDAKVAPPESASSFESSLWPEPLPPERPTWPFWVAGAFGVLGVTASSFAIAYAEDTEALREDARVREGEFRVDASALDEARTSQRLTLVSTVAAVALGAVALGTLTYALWPREPSEVEYSIAPTPDGGAQTGLRIQF